MKLTNQQCNHLIIANLIKTAEQYPHWRFGQILRNLGIVQEIRNNEGMPIAWNNEFQTLSSVILDRSEKEEKKLK